MQIGSGNVLSQGFADVVTAVRSSGNRVVNELTTNTTTLANISSSINQLSSAGSSSSQMDLSPVTSVLRRISADLTNLIRLTDSSSRRIANAISNAGGGSGQPAAAPQETDDEKSARLLAEAEAKRQERIQRRRSMLKRVGQGALKYSGANAAGRGLKNVARRIRSAAGSVLTWGTVISAAFAYFVNSPYWDKFTELLADSTKEGGWLNTFIKFVQNIFKPLEGIQEDLLKGEFGKAADKLADFFISLMNRLIVHINDALGPFGNIDLIKTNKVEEEEKKLKKSANELSPETKMPGVGGLVDTSKEFAKNNPITPEMSELEAGLIKNATETRESLEAVAGFVADSFIGDQFAYFGDYLNTQASKATGTMLKLKTMSDDQIADRQRELANMTDEDYGEAGAMRLQMEVEDLNKLGKSRMEVLAAFDKESQRRNDGGKRPAGDELTPAKTGGNGDAVGGGSGDDQMTGANGGGTVPPGIKQAGANANSGNVRPVAPPVAPVAAPQREMPINPADNNNNKGPAQGPSIHAPKAFPDTGMLSKLTQQAWG